MEFSVGDQVWANFGGVWYPGFVVGNDSLPDPLEEGQIGVMFSDKTGAAIPVDLLEPISSDLEARKLHPDVAPIWDEFQGLAQSQANGETQDETQDDPDQDGALSDPEKARKRADREARKEAKKAEKEAKKAMKATETPEERAERKRLKKAAKKGSDEDEDDNIEIGELETLLRDAGTVDPAAADRSSPRGRVRRTQMGTGGQHLEQPVGRIADLQLNLIKNHYNNVLASEVAGANTRLMPCYERDYLATAERAIQRRSRIERFLSASLKRGDANIAANPAVKTVQDSLRDFDLTKAFGLPSTQVPALPSDASEAAPDAVILKSVSRGSEVAVGIERLKNVTRLYYRDQLTSVADGTSLVPVEAIPYHMANMNRGTRRSQKLSQGLGGTGSLLGGRFSSTQLSGAPLGLQASHETKVMSQWRTFRELPPRTDEADVQFIPPAGALAQRFDEAGQALIQKAQKLALRAFSKDEQLLYNIAHQTAEIRRGNNIGYNDIPAAGGPPAGPEDFADSYNYEGGGDIIARQLLELGEVSQGGESGSITEKARTFLTLTQRVGPLSQEQKTQMPTQFNFHDFGALAAQKRATRLEMGSVDHASLPIDSLLGSHAMIGSNIPENPLTPINYGYDIDEAYRSEDAGNRSDPGDLRSLKSGDLPSVASLWQKGSIAVDEDTPKAHIPLTAAALAGIRSSGTNNDSAAEKEVRNTIREQFLKEAKSLTVTLEALLADSPSPQYRSSSGVIVKQSTIREVLEYLKDVSNLRQVVEKLVPRALEQLSSRLLVRSSIDPAPILAPRELQQLRNSFRRQIERAHRVDTDGLNKLVPSIVSRPASTAARSSTSGTRSSHSRSTGMSLSVRQSNVGQRRSRERDYDE